MANIGITPPAPESPVGALRLLVGDFASIPLDPDQEGLGDYSVWSDAALSVALASAMGNAYRAAWSLYIGLAAEYMQSSRSIKTDDLAIDTRGRGSDLLRVAQSFLDEATAIESATADEAFAIIPFAGRANRRQYSARPEGTPYPLF